MAEDCTVVHFTGEPSTVRIESLKTNEVPYKMPETNQFGSFYTFCIILSILTYIIDIGLAIILLFYYHTNGFGAYFAVTLTFILLPALFMTAFNLRWYIVDHDDQQSKTSTCQWVVRIAFLLLQISPLLRYFDTLYYGIRSVICRNSGQSGQSDQMQVTIYYRKMLDEDSNGALLRLFHCFLHSGPQCVIQLIILVKFLGDENQSILETEMAVVQAWTVLAGVISISWSLTSYHRSIRFARDDKNKVSWEGILVAFIWHLMSVTSRILALGLLAVIYPSWMGFICILHWIVMSLWLTFEHLTANCVNKCEELFLSCALGLAYVLAFISPRDGPTRYVYLAYYLVCFMENTGALVVWCVTNNSLNNEMLYYGAPITQLITFILAVTFLLLYYRYFHPSSPKGIFITCPSSKSGLSKSYNLRSYS